MFGMKNMCMKRVLQVRDPPSLCLPFVYTASDQNQDCGKAWESMAGQRIVGRPGNPWLGRAEIMQSMAGNESMQERIRTGDSNCIKNETEQNFLPILK